MHRSKFDVRGERAYSRAYPRWDHILEYRFDLGNFGEVIHVPNKRPTIHRPTTPSLSA